MGWGAGDGDGVEGEGAFGANDEGVDVEALDGVAVPGGEFDRSVEQGRVVEDLSGHVDGVAGRREGNEL